MEVQWDILDFRVFMNDCPSSLVAVYERLISSLSVEVSWWCGSCVKSSTIWLVAVVVREPSSYSVFTSHLKHYSLSFHLSSLRHIVGSCILHGCLCSTVPGRRWLVSHWESFSWGVVMWWCGCLAGLANVGCSRCRRCLCWALLASTVRVLAVTQSWCRGCLWSVVADVNSQSAVRRAAADDDDVFRWSRLARLAVWRQRCLQQLVSFIILFLFYYYQFYYVWCRRIITSVVVVLLCLLLLMLFLLINFCCCCCCCAYKKLSCRRDDAWCFVSLNVSLSHSRSFKMTPLASACSSRYLSFVVTVSVSYSCRDIQHCCSAGPR